MTRDLLLIITTLMHCAVLSLAMSIPSSSYDLLVVGGGSAGLTAAKFASTFGKVINDIHKSS